MRLIVHDLFMYASTFAGWSSIRRRCTFGIPPLCLVVPYVWSLLPKCRNSLWSEQVISGLCLPISRMLLTPLPSMIRAISGLEACTLLEELWLGKNKITQIGGISTLVRLKRLDVQSNR